MNAVAVIFALCFASAYSLFMRDDEARNRINSDCLVEYGIDPDHNSEASGPLSDEKIYCIVACVYRDYGIMRPDGTIDTDRAESFFGADDADERNIFFSVYKACEKGNAGCKLAQCMFRELRNHWSSASSSNKVTRRLLHSKGVAKFI